jgi:hypothetical protein
LDDTGIGALMRRLHPREFALAARKRAREAGEASTSTKSGGWEDMLDDNAMSEAETREVEMAKVDASAMCALFRSWEYGDRDEYVWTFCEQPSGQNFLRAAQKPQKCVDMYGNMTEIVLSFSDARGGDGAGLKLVADTKALDFASFKRIFTNRCLQDEEEVWAELDALGIGPGLTEQLKGKVNEEREHVQEEQMERRDACTLACTTATLPPPPQSQHEMRVVRVVPSARMRLDEVLLAWMKREETVPKERVPTLIARGSVLVNGSRMLPRCSMQVNKWDRIEVELHPAKADATDDPGADDGAHDGAHTGCSEDCSGGLYSSKDCSGGLYMSDVLPRRLLLHVLDYLEGTDLQKLSSAANNIGVLSTAATCGFLWERREQICFYTKRHYEEGAPPRLAIPRSISSTQCGVGTVLGYPINVGLHKKTKALNTVSSWLELLSFEAFSECNVRKSVWKEPFRFWLPIFITEEHADRGRAVCERMLMAIFCSELSDDVDNKRDYDEETARSMDQKLLLEWQTRSKKQKLALAAKEALKEERPGGDDSASVSSGMSTASTRSVESGEERGLTTLAGTPMASSWLARRKEAKAGGKAGKGKGLVTSRTAKGPDGTRGFRLARTTATTVASPSGAGGGYMLRRWSSLQHGKSAEGDDGDGEDTRSSVPADFAYDVGSVVDGSCARWGQCSSFRPAAALSVLCKLMSAQGVLMMKGELYISERALEGYCQFHRLLLRFAEWYPEIKRMAEEQIERFIHHEHYRHKRHVASLGDFLPLLSITDKYNWSDIQEAYLAESTDRNALWILKMYPQHHHAPPANAVFAGSAWSSKPNEWHVERAEVEGENSVDCTSFDQCFDVSNKSTQCRYFKRRDEPDAPPVVLGQVERQQRISEAFEATVVGKRLLCFNVYFFNRVAKPDNAPLAEVSALYDRSYGKPTRQMKLELQAKMKQIMKMETMEGFYQELGMRMPDERRLEQNLKTAIVNSLRRKYHIPKTLGIPGFEQLVAEPEPRRLAYKAASGDAHLSTGGERSGFGSGQRRSLQDMLDSSGR